MKNKLITLIVWTFCAISVSAQDAVTSLTTTIYDEALQLDIRDKKTHCKYVNLEISETFWNQFERIDAVFISTWVGVGEDGLEQYRKDSLKMGGDKGMTPILYYAEKSAATFSRPAKQTGFGLETVLMREDADEKCIGKYTGKKIAPRGFFPCLIKRQWTTTPVDYMYRYALSKEFYAAEKQPAFLLFLRSSTKADSVLVYAKVAVTIRGKRYEVTKKPSVDAFMEAAVLNGLKKDAFPKDQAKWILQNSMKLFVGKCPICMPTERAFNKYLEVYEEKETSTPADILTGLSKDNKEDMQKAFSQLINRYVEAHFETLALNSRDEADMKKELEAERKVGMSRKRADFGDFCPSCDGACKVKH